MMRTKLGLLTVAVAWILTGCVYAENPDGRFVSVDLPLQNQTTIHKTVTVNAPAGTTVILSETPPPTVVYREVRPRRECYFDRQNRRRVCYE